MSHDMNSRSHLVGYQAPLHSLLLGHVRFIASVADRLRLPIPRPVPHIAPIEALTWAVPEERQQQIQADETVVVAMHDILQAAFPVATRSAATSDITHAGVDEVLQEDQGLAPQVPVALWGFHQDDVPL